MPKYVYNLVFHDGQDFFDYPTDFIGTASTKENAIKLLKQKLTKFYDSETLQEAMDDDRLRHVICIDKTTIDSPEKPETTVLDLKQIFK